MFRRVVVPLAITLVPIFLPAQASAVSDWDSDDTKGLFDLRWFGAAFTADGEEIQLTLSFYEGFDPAALPRYPRRSESMVWIQLTALEQGDLDGWFLKRPDGRIIFEWGEGGHFRLREVVHRPSPNVLSVRIGIRSVYDPTRPGFPIYRPTVHSSWHEGGTRFADWMDPLDLGPQPVIDWP